VAGECEKYPIRKLINIFDEQLLSRQGMTKEHLEENIEEGDGKVEEDLDRNWERFKTVCHGGVLSAAYVHGQHWPLITLPANNLPLKMAASYLHYSEVPLYCQDGLVVICLWNSSEEFW